MTKTHKILQDSYSQPERKNDWNKLKILNTNRFEDLYLLNQGNPIYYRGVTTGGGGGGPPPPPPPLILYLQGGPLLSGKIYFTNSVYSLSTIIM